MEDLNKELTTAFKYLRDNISGLETPEIYAQIGSLDQSIIVGNNTIGICLDKYLGSDNPLYQKPEYGYTSEQLSMMNRHFIVPDCVGFYLLSLYPMPTDRVLSQLERDIHIGKIQWAVNKAMGKRVFQSKYIQRVQRYMLQNKNATLDMLLRNNNYQDFQ